MAYKFSNHTLNLPGEREIHQSGLESSKRHDSLLWRQCYLQERMRRLTPSGLDLSWIWHDGPVKNRGLPDTTQLDCYSLQEVLPLLMGDLSPGSTWSDSEMRKMRGAHYTPQYLVDSVIDACGVKESQRVCDPAVGSGIWLSSWMNKWVEIGFGTPLDCLELIFAVDIDPLAVAVTRFSLWKTVNWDTRAIPILTEQIRCADSCVHDIVDLWPKLDAYFDLILGNPPWLFLSGRGSPVARLKSMGLKSEAADFKAWIDEVSKRYPYVSKGCKDLAKWFVGIGLKWMASGGVLAQVLPESMIRLPRYRDVREALSQSGAVTIWINPSDTFSVTVRSCVVFLQSGESQSKVKLLDNRHDKPLADVQIVGSDWPVYQSQWAKECYLEPGPRLGDWVWIAEGLHDLRFEDSSMACLVQAVDHRRLGKDLVVGTRLAFLNNVLTNGTHHQGPRLVLRKTGSKLCAAEVDTIELAYAHQNVYVLKLKPECPLSLQQLVLLLNSPEMSRLYQHSPLGLPEQPMAQLRVVALRSLPIPKRICSSLGLMGDKSKN